MFEPALRFHLLATAPAAPRPCREFLRSKLSGLLRVTIRRATSLPAADPAPLSSDPYLVVSAGGSSCSSSYTTRTILNNLNPEWHETCNLFVRHGGRPAVLLPCTAELAAARDVTAACCALACRDAQRQALTAQVFDYDFGAEDDYLGSAVADLQGLCDGQQHDLQLELRGSPFAAAADDQGGAASEGGSTGGSQDGSSGSSASSGSVQLSCCFLPFRKLLADGVAEPEVAGQPLLAAPEQVGSCSGTVGAACAGEALLHARR